MFQALQRAPAAAASGNGAVDDGASKRPAEEQDDGLTFHDLPPRKIARLADDRVAQMEGTVQQHVPAARFLAVASAYRRTLLQGNRDSTTETLAGHGVCAARVNWMTACTQPNRLMYAATSDGKVQH